MHTQISKVLSLYLLLILLQPFALSAAELTLDQSPEGKFSLGPYMEILEDSGGTLTFEEVQNSGEFQSNDKETPNFGFTPSVYWGKFTLNNQNQDRTEWVMELGYPLLDYIDFWIPDETGAYQQRSSGDKLPFSAREMNYRNFIFYVNLQHGETKEVYFRVETESSTQIPLSIWSSRSFTEHINKELYGFGIYYGIMLSMILYNLFIYISVKDQSYLYYVLYITSYLMFQMSLNGLAYEHLWPNSIWWANVAIPILLSFSLAGALRFAQTFLDIKERLPKLDKAMTVLLAVLGVCVLMALFSTYALAIRVSAGTAVICVGFIAYAGITIWRQGFRPAGYYLLAWSSILIGSLIFALKSFGVLPTTFITANGMQIGSALEVILLSLGLADRINVMKKEKFLAERESRESSQRALELLKIADQQKEENLKIIGEHAKTLETKVTKRTKSIKDLMDNTGQGFLSFGQNYLINKEYSKACEEMLGQELVEKNALEVLFSSSPEIDLKKTEELFFMVFLGTEISLLEPLFPKKIIHNEKHLSLEFKLIGSAEEKEQKIMVILTDITKEVALSKQLKNDEERQAIVVKVAMDKNGFLQFLKELEELFGSIQQSLIGPIEEFDIALVMRCYHTIKGGCASYSMTKVAKAAHEIESLLEPISKRTKNLDHELLKLLREDTSKLEKELHQILTELNDIIPPEERNLQKTFYRVSDEKIVKLEDFMLSRIGSEHLALIKNEIDSLIAQPLGPLLRKFASVAEDLGKQLNKTLSVSLKGAEIEIPIHKYDSFFAAFIHLVRNSVDHGLEDTDIREMLGKKPEGQIRIEAAVNATSFVILVADDGGGIDAERVTQIALEKKIISEDKAKNITDEETYELIFAPGFSTKEAVTDISGRGVGMDAVKTAVEDLKGNIKIKSTLEQGSSFTIQIPLVS